MGLVLVCACSFTHPRLHSLARTQPSDRQADRRGTCDGKSVRKRSLAVGFLLLGSCCPPDCTTLGLPNCSPSVTCLSATPRQSSSARCSW